MHLKELVAVRLRVDLLMAQFFHQSDIACLQVCFLQFTHLLNGSSPAFQRTFIGKARLIFLNLFNRQHDGLLVEEAINMHLLGLLFKEELVGLG